MKGKELKKEQGEQLMVNRSPFTTKDVDIDPIGSMTALLGGSLMEDKRFRRKEQI